MRWDLKFGDYVDLTQLEPLPTGDYGHTAKVTKPWGMYMNDALGCCVVSAKQHKVRLWHSEGFGSDTVTFADAITVKNYSLFGNYQLGNPDSDQGCDMVTAAQLEVKKGVLDDLGKRHKPGIALQLQPGNWEQLLYAIYYFDGVELGILVTPAMQQAFANEQPWDISQFNTADVEGGHCVLATDRKDGLPEVVSWGAPQKITKALYTAPQFNTITMAYASPEKLSLGVDLEGLGWSDMRSTMRKISRL
jgi:hypothetical protein